MALGSVMHAEAQTAPDKVRQEARFDILEFAVQGNTTLPAETIERAVYAFMGERRAVADVENARAALERAYREAGYGTVTVEVPEQKVVDGTVELQVQEGRVSRLRVTGARYYSQGYILDKVPGAAEGTVPNFNELQAQLASVNRSTDRRVTPLLRPGRSPGTTEVDLAVEDQMPLHGSLELNNRSSPNTSQARLQASLRYDNLWQREHSLGVQLQVSPQKTDEVRVLSTSYTVPLGTSGQDSVSFSYTRSDSTVPAGVAGTTVFGKGDIFGLRYNKVLELAEGRYQALTLGADYKDLIETIDAGDKTGFSTPVRYLPLSANWLGLFDDAQGRWQFGAGLVVGVRGLASKEQQFADKRYLGSSAFSVFKFDATREQKLPAGLLLVGRVDLQASGQPLISNEQYVAGGVDTVRGYLESSAVGDVAARGSVELRSPELAPKDWSWLAGFKAHAFVDGAALELRSPLEGQARHAQLLGVGFGVRVKTKPYGNLSLDIAWPLQAVGQTQRGDVRVHAAGSLEF